MELYLKPTFTIESTCPDIIKTAKDITLGCANNKEKAVRLFSFVRDSIIYDPNMISMFVEDFRASKILAWKRAYCVQKVVLLTALARSVGVPSRLGFAKIRNHRAPAHMVKKYTLGIFPRHGYNQFYLDDRWVSATVAFNKSFCEDHGLPLVVFDGEIDAFLPDKDITGGPFIEYLEFFEPNDDLPFDWIYERISKIVGADKRPVINDCD